MPARQVAVIGLGHSRKFAPWTDPAWEKWCLAWDPKWDSADRLFQMHDIEVIRENKDTPHGSSSVSWPRITEDFGIPLYMREQYFPHVIRYPLEDVIRSIGRDYFESSISFLFALALSEDVERVGLWGVHMRANTEYGRQKPNMEWLLGIAQGRGTDVILPDVPLLKFNGGKPLPTFNGRKAVRYGQWE